MVMMNDDNPLLPHDIVTAPTYNEYIFKTKLHKFYVIANLILCSYSYIAEIGFIRLCLSSDQFLIIIIIPTIIKCILISKY